MAANIPPAPIKVKNNSHSKPGNMTGLVVDFWVVCVVVEVVVFLVDVVVVEVVFVVGVVIVVVVVTV